MEHATLQPSSAARWVQCPGSVTMAAMYPQEETDASLEGTLAHEVCARMLDDKDTASLRPTEEMLDGAEMLYDDVMAIGKTMNSHVKPIVEKRVNCFDVHQECWGTPDVRMLDVALNKLYIWDYKFGHSPIEVFENYQSLCYTIGAVANYGSATTDNLEIHLRIVQPRVYRKHGPITEWVFKAPELDFHLEILKERAHEAMGPNPVTRAGPECRNCPARHACPTLQKSAYESVGLSGDATPFDLSPGAVGRELVLLQSAADILKARISGLEQEATAKIKAGLTVPGWMLEQSNGREKFSAPVEEILALGEMMGVSLAKPGLITPKQAIKAGIPAAVIAGYTETPRGEIKLVRDSQLLKVFK